MASSQLPTHQAGWNLPNPTVVPANHYQPELGTSHLAVPHRPHFPMDPAHAYMQNLVPQQQAQLYQQQRPAPLSYPSQQMNNYMPTPTHFAQTHLHPSLGQAPVNPQQYAAQQAHLQQQRQQQQQAVLEHQHAQRRAKKPTDRNMPDGIEDIIIGDGVQQYKVLREQERRLDYAVMRKRLDLQDTFHRSNKRQKTLRVWISNTADNQPWQRNGLEENAFDFDSAGESTVRVKIEGRLLDDPEDDIMDSDDEAEDDQTSKPEKKNPPTYKMSHFFKNMTVEFDKHRNNVPDPGWQIEWKKQQGTNDVDLIHFTRRCDENVNINIKLTRDEAPDRYKLSEPLASTLDMAEGDRAEVVMAIWEYIRCFNLQEDEDKRIIRCDDQLRQVFNMDQIHFPQIPERIMAHLLPLDSVKLPYTVRVDQEFLNNPEPTVYDIKVVVEDPLRARVLAMHQNPDLHSGLRQIAQLDEQLAVIVQALQHSKARHTFFKSMAKDPAGFVNKWMKSQRRDLEVILGEATRGGGEDGSGPEFARGGKDGVWGSESVTEAVRYMLAKPQATKA
ncbi:SWI/SNF and RSC complex subunit Ssr3 [Lithohypha guttulata]|uniref:SWI/SNF and RSC complex subunit Ssr3 n=1 Tax=Lithohypha guttulata TaxID=1690604 RepID=A0AAN7Y8N0_9EURO|nr:SWI/SNF and RSC complex subunit Ssr3 [Lithohypha guttulata]